MSHSESNKQPNARNRQVLCLISDLIFATKIRSTASAMDLEATVVSRTDALVAHLSDHPVALIVIDLEAAGDPMAAIEHVAKIRSADATHSQMQILAYCSHVRANLMEKARQNGAEEVWPRSRFADQLPQLLATLGARGHD